MEEIKEIEVKIEQLKKLKDPDDEYIIMDLEQEKKELKKANERIQKNNK